MPVEDVCREFGSQIIVAFAHQKEMTLDTGYPLAEEFYTKITGSDLAVMTYRLSFPKRPSPCHNKAQLQVKQQVNQLKSFYPTVRPFCDVMAGEHSCAAL